MKYWLVLFLSCFLITGSIFAQQPDSLSPAGKDTLAVSDSLLPSDTILVNPLADSVSKKPVMTDSAWQMPVGSSEHPGIITNAILEHHPYFGFAAALQPLPPGGQPRKASGKEWIFYMLVLLLMVFGFLKMLFPKYFSDLFRLFFRTTIKQRQIKEQLMQTPLPSLMLNAFFVLSTGLYVSFMMVYFELNTIGNFWLLLLYCCGGLSLMYFVKFAGLKIAGWLFNMEEAADAYVFIVFVVNKMLGILLLPFLVLIAFTVGRVYSAGLTLSWCLVGGLLLYRFILTYSAVRNLVRVNPFHFILYIAAFEIAPLLLIYKALLLFFRITA